MLLQYTFCLREFWTIEDTAVMRCVCKDFSSLPPVAADGKPPSYKKILSDRIVFWEWLIGQSTPKSLCVHAARLGNFELLRWAHRKVEGSIKNKWVAAYAAKHGNLDAVIWASQQGCPITDFTLTYAAYGGHIHVMQWLIDQGCKPDALVSDKTAVGGHLDALKWLVIEKKCRCSSWVATHAIIYSHLHVLYWAVDHGCPLSTVTFAFAAKHGDIHVLNYLKSKGCPMDFDFFCYAAREGHLHVIDWALEQGYSVPSNCYAVCDFAAKRQDKTMLHHPPHQPRLPSLGLMSSDSLQPQSITNTLEKLCKTDRLDPFHCNGMDHERFGFGLQYLFIL